LDAGSYGSTTTGKLLSPTLLPVGNKQRCLIFAYRVMSGNSNGIPILKVTFGGIPHWESHEGEGRVIIGLYQFNISTRVGRFKLYFLNSMFNSIILLFCRS